MIEILYYIKSRRLAEEADFFSFGTNDPQMSFASVGMTLYFLPNYLYQKILKMIRSRVSTRMT
jgi:hypothetical protein